MQAFLAGFGLSLSLCLDLGIVNVAIIHAGLQGGFVPAFWLGVGSSVGDLVYAVASLSLLSLLLAHRTVRWVLWIGGTILLVGLALQMLVRAVRPAAAFTAPAGARPATMLTALARGIALALGSPSSILWFAAVGGAVIATNAEPGMLGPFLFGFFSCGIVWTVGLAGLAAYGRRNLGPGLVRALSLGASVVFAALAVRVFVQGYRALLS